MISLDEEKKKQSKEFHMQQERPNFWTVILQHITQGCDVYNVEFGLATS